MTQQSRKTHGLNRSSLITHRESLHPESLHPESLHPESLHPESLHL